MRNDKAYHSLKRDISLKPTASSCFCRTLNTIAGNAVAYFRALAG